MLFVSGGWYSRCSDTRSLFTRQLAYFMPVKITIDEEEEDMGLSQALSLRVCNIMWCLFFNTSIGRLLGTCQAWVRSYNSIIQCYFVGVLVPFIPSYISSRGQSHGTWDTVNISIELVNGVWTANRTGNFDLTRLTVLPLSVEHVWSSNKVSYYPWLCRIWHLDDMTFFGVPNAVLLSNF